MKKHSGRVVIEDAVTVSLKMSRRHLDHIKTLSHRLSLDRGISLNQSDVIREALERIFPLPGDRS